MKLEKINDSPEKLKQYFSIASLYGSVFNSELWVNTFIEYLEVYGIFDANEKLTGGFQISREKRGGIFSFLRTPLYQPSIAFFFEQKAKNPAKRNDEIRSYIRFICESPELKATVKSFAFSPDYRDMIPFVLSGYKVVPNYTYQIDLKNKEEEIFALFSPERRNDITRAQKDGLTCRMVTDISVVYDIISQTFSGKDDKLYPDRVKKLMSAFSGTENSCSFVTYSGETPIAANFIVYSPQRSYYLLGGYSHKNRHGGAGALAIWEAMKYLKSKEVKFFDFEGSMLPEVEKYFRGFGGELVPYFTVNKASFLAEVILKLVKRSQF